MSERRTPAMCLIFIRPRFGGHADATTTFFYYGHGAHMADFQKTIIVLVASFVLVSVPVRKKSFMNKMNTDLLIAG
jgi:hypothetical protein